MLVVVALVVEMEVVGSSENKILDSTSPEVVVSTDEDDRAYMCWMVHGWFMGGSWMAHRWFTVSSNVIRHISLGKVHFTQFL